MTASGSNPAASAEADVQPKIVDGWSAIASVAGVLVGVITAFLWKPPFEFGTTDTLPNAARYFVGIVVGLLTYPLVTFYRTRFVAIWSSITALALIVGTSLLLLYYQDTVLWVRQPVDGSAPQAFVIGSTLSAPAMAAREKSAKAGNPLSDAALLAQFPAAYPENVYAVWGRSGVARNELTLAALYLGTILAYSIASVGVVQSVRCVAP